MLEFDNIPNFDFKEDSTNNRMTNYNSDAFKRRFGTVIDPIFINDNIYENEYTNNMEKLNIRSFVNAMTNQQKIKIRTFDDIYNNRIRIYNHLVYRCNDKQISPLTFSKNILTLSLLLLHCNPFKKNIRMLCNNLNQYAISISRQIQKNKYHNNTQSFDYVPFNEIVEMRDEIYNLSKHNDHMKYIRLCMNTYIPPLRLELQGMRYNISPAEPVNTPNDTTNYLIKYNDIYYIVINHDKVINRYGQCVFKLDKVNNYMDCQTLTNILNYSFDLLPRDYVICTNNKPTEPMNNTTFYNLLPFGQNIIRQSYHTYYEKIYTPNLTNGDLTDIANRMRHSLNIARLIYIKIEPTQPVSPNTYKYKRSKDNRYLNYLINGKIKNPSNKKLLLHGIHMIDGVYCFTPDKLTERKIHTFKKI